MSQADSEAESDAGESLDPPAVEAVVGHVGRIAAIYRYPVRSMRGESLAEAEVSELGLLGDRAYSVFDPTDNAMASASTGARNWKGLLQWQAVFTCEPLPSTDPPPIRLIRSDGKVLQSDDPGFEEELSEALGRPARMWRGDTRGALSCAAAEKRAQERGEATGTSALPSVPYPSAPLHVITTASIAAAGDAYPKGRFEVERFRPNIVIETSPELEGFVEKDWLEQELVIGGDAGTQGGGVELRVLEETERCVATTLPQFDLPKDSQIIRAIAKNNRNQMGIYAAVPRGGRICLGDRVSLRSPVAALDQ